MNWFTRNRETAPILVTPPAPSRVEIELHKNASQEAAKKADQTNEHLKELLIENGFTLKIFLAAGGHLPVKPNRGAGAK